MVDCVDILRSITKSCGDNVGGVNKRVWITQLQQIENYTFDSLGYVNSLVTKENGNTNYPYELKKVISKKGSHSGNVEAIENVNIDVFKHTAILKAYATTPEQRDSLVSLYGASKVVVFFETDNGDIEIYGLENGLYATALTGNTGEQMQDDTAFTFTLSGLQTSLPKYFLYGGSLHTSIAYLDNIGLTPIYEIESFSAKFSSVSSLDLTGCFLDSNGNNCATLINWGDGTIDSNLTHTYSISGDYVVSVACDNAVEIFVLGNTITEFYYAIPIGLQNLYLGENQIVDFNPSIALPIGLQELDLGGNQMTIAGYTASETWANAQPSFTSSCNVYFKNNIDSVSGTDLETILISKNCTVSV